MSLVFRITLMTLLVCGAALFVVTRIQLNETVRRYREATEEPLVDIAMVLAATVAEASHDSILSTESIKESLHRAQNAKLDAKIYELERTGLDLRIYVTDTNGVVKFDSDGGRDEGKDYSHWIDVFKTLHGEYGARSTKTEGIDGKLYSTLYVAAPITRDGVLLGSLTVGKSTRSADLFARGAKNSTLGLGLTAFAACVLLALVLAFAVSAPVTRLTRYAKDIRDGKRAVLPKLPSGEIRNLGAAFEEMRDALEGRQYVEKYVQTLAHALKSPLSGIRGAVELLKEELPAEDRNRFVSNIAGDSARMQQLLDKLLALSTLQKEKALASAEPLSIQAVADDAIASVSRLATSKEITIALTSVEDLKVRGNKLWLQEAFANLLLNAVEFSPRASSIEVVVESSGPNCIISIRDHGPGIPEWAASQIFDRFYSLPRPDGGPKSTGLGLSLVREVAELHAGAVTIKSHPDGGAIATFSMPLSA